MQKTVRATQLDADNMFFDSFNNFSTKMDQSALLYLLLMPDR